MVFNILYKNYFILNIIFIITIYIIFKNSVYIIKDINSLLMGEYNDISISNSNFYNLISRAVIPVILNSPHSKINIFSTNFKNIT